MANPSVSTEILEFTGSVLKIRGQKPSHAMRVLVEQHTKIRKHKYSDGTSEISKGFPDYYWVVDADLGCKCKTKTATGTTCATCADALLSYGQARREQAKIDGRCVSCLHNSHAPGLVSCERISAGNKARKLTRKERSE